ncbi:MAG: 2-oxoglutarate dehydrogenase complex dihydrolipoyllysine-residue succinyltransferase [Pseudomonadota bacterium]
MIEVKVPQLPESVTDAVLIAWHKAPGDAVSRDENLVDLETDKVVLEVPAPASGKLVEMKVEDGATVTSGEILALLDETATAQAAPAPAPAEAPAAAETPAVPAAEATGPSEAPRMGPAARRLAGEHGVNPQSVPASGRAGRVTKGDVQAFISSGDSGSANDAAPAVDLPLLGSRAERRVPMTRLRTRIAERMVEAQQTAAILTSFNEVDLMEVMALRKRYKESFEKAHGVRLGFMSFFVKAAVEALRRYPVVNASVEGGDIVFHEYQDVGVAVSTERGLVVPVLRDAGHMAFSQIEQGVVDYATRAREGAITLEELTGGTFTITNGGVFGSLMSTPILNPPQSAILGMHKIQERPVVVDGQVVPRPMMYIALSYDHRIIDGREAVLFLVAVKEMLEDPARLMLQV